MNWKKLRLKIVCCFFDDIIHGTKTNFSYILLDKSIYENISVYNILYKTPTVFQIVLIIILERSKLIHILSGLRSRLFFAFLGLGWEIAQENPNYTTDFL